MTETDGSAALDSNLLLLYLATTKDSLLPLIGTWKRLNGFEPDDARTLLRILRRFHSLLTTPHVLTETSNFAGQLQEPLRRVLLEALRSFVQTAHEESTPATALVIDASFLKLRLADCGLLQLPGRCTLITVDFELSARRSFEGKLALNFNHER